VSDASLPVPDARWQRLPARLRPRTVERGGTGSMRAVETTLLVLAALLLAIATVNDVGRQVSINHRLIADLRTWRHYTGHDYRNISIDQQTLGLDSRREVLCGNTSPGPPEGRTQICLAIWGAVVDGRRAVHGGWYLPPRSVDLPGNRYGCFGPAAAGMCRR
jgi:hypothetical protein